MSQLGGVMIAALASFAATNIDDLVILTIFFAQVNATLRCRQIVVGQYLGFTAIIIASLPGFFGGMLVSKAWIGILGLVPIAIGVRSLINLQRDDDIQAVSDKVMPNTSVVSFLAKVSPQTYNIAAVTFANGGDNIGIYVPLFANSELASLVVTLGVFFLLLGVWCYIAYQLARISGIAHVLTHYGNAIAPIILIGLGIYILIESGTYQLVTDFKWI
jgi:cadmium resistance transport/sequestration family protein